MIQIKKVNPLKPRKGQKCWLCKKEIKKGDWCYNGHYFHGKCKNKDSAERIKEYLKNNNLNKDEKDIRNRRI